MAKSFATVLAVVLVGVAGCSWLTDFVVANYSETPITVSYTLKTYDGGFSYDCEKLLCNDKPGVTAVDNLSRQEYRVLAPNEYFLDKEKCEIRYELGPHQAIRIGTIGTYTGHQSGRDRDFFYVRSLKVVTNRGLLYFEKHEMVKQFRKIKESLYVYEYK